MIVKMFTDKDIVEGCKKGKSKLQNVLYERYSGMLLGVCLRYIGNKMEAEDVLHDAFIKIYYNIKNFNFIDGSSLSAWMRRIVANTSLNYLRDKAKFNFCQDINKIDIADESEYDSDINEEVVPVNPEVLMKIIQELPKGYNLVFNLYVFEKYSHQEIAEQLGISVNTSKTQLMKARNYIKNKVIKKKMNEVPITA